MSVQGANSAARRNMAVAYVCACAKLRVEGAWGVPSVTLIAAACD